MTNVLLAVRHLRTVLSLILTNSEVRKLLSDFSIIGRDLLAKGAEKAAVALRPREDELAKVDEPVQGDAFVSKKGDKAAAGATPMLDVRIPGTDINIQHSPENQGVKVVCTDGTEKSAGEFVQEGKDEMQKQKASALSQVEQMKEEAQQSAQENGRPAREEG